MCMGNMKRRALKKALTTKQWADFLDSDDYLWGRVYEKGFYCKEMRRLWEKYGHQDSLQHDRFTERPRETAERIEDTKDVLRIHYQRLLQLFQQTQNLGETREQYQEDLLEPRSWN